MSFVLPAVVVAIVALPALVGATDLQDIQDDSVGICQRLRAMHPTMAPLRVVAAGLTVLTCHSGDDKAYPDAVLMFTNTAAVLRLRSGG